MSRSRIAPTFHNARITLHEKLEEFVCGVLSRNVKIPDNAREIDDNGKTSITYYHALVQKSEATMRHKSSRQRRTMIWLNKNTRANRPLKISAAEFHNDSEDIPTPGEIVVGAVQHREDNKASFRYWHGKGRCFWELKKLVQHGTSDFKRLRQKLRTQDLYDDLFVVGAVVLFGDVQLVVDEIMQKEDRRYRLRLRSKEPLICFLHKLSVDLKDPKIWERVVEILPDAEERLATESPETEEGSLSVVPLTESYAIHPLFQNEVPIDEVPIDSQTSSWGSLTSKTEPPQQTSNGFLWPSQWPSQPQNNDLKPYQPKSPTYGPPTSPQNNNDFKPYQPKSPTYGPPTSPQATTSSWSLAPCQNLDFMNDMKVSKKEEEAESDDDDIIIYSRETDVVDNEEEDGDLYQNL
jgi:hypothetical protein